MPGCGNNKHNLRNCYVRIKGANDKYFYKQIGNFCLNCGFFEGVF